MKLTVFQSDKGDCLLLETADGKHRMLVDGGMRQAYEHHVRPTLGAMSSAKKQLDIIYVSHVDRDHISGVLQMLDDEAAWRVHNYHVKRGNTKHRRPTAPRPPMIGQIFHNAFHDQIRKNRGRIENMLAATSQMLSASDDPELRKLAEAQHNLATSIPEGIRVSKRVAKGQLNIKLNPQFKGRLMMVKKGMKAIKLGSITLDVIGPFSRDLTKLRKEWNAWLEEHEKVVADLQGRAERDEELFGQEGLSSVLSPLSRASDSLGAMEVRLAKVLGSRKKVTTPNLASLMFLAKENGQTILFTGDGHADDILRGLEHQKVMDEEGRCHVTVLKGQHHGSEHNWHRDFCDRVTADHYVFCGNGEHQNPDLAVLQLICDRRLVADERKFKFWFNSSSNVSSRPEGREHMKKVEDLMTRLAKKSGGRVTRRFIRGSSMRVL